MKRREFIALIGSIAATGARVAHAQERERTRLVGVLMSYAAGDRLAQNCSAAFEQALQQSGWPIGRNLRIEYRWGAGDTERFRQYAAELVAMTPDVIVGNAASIVAALQRASRTVPIVFVTTIDPVGAGLVASLPRPGGNATGFTNGEFSLNAKLLELLKEVAPGVSRVAVLRDATVSAGSGGFAAIQTAAPSFGVELTPIGVRDADEIERGLAAFAGSGSSNGMIVVGPPSSMQTLRDLTVSLAARHRLPAVYATLAFVDAGALVSYGVDVVDQFRRAAGYVDRILKGGKPADLPVQDPTTFTVAINLKTAKALSLVIPNKLLATAGEVIE
jgi:putative tryptophan/tyrosine transport system substrate-binding protein